MNGPSLTADVHHLLEIENFWQSFDQILGSYWVSENVACLCQLVPEALCKLTDVGIIYVVVFGVPDGVSGFCSKLSRFTSCGIYAMSSLLLPADEATKASLLSENTFGLFTSAEDTRCLFLNPQITIFCQASRNTVKSC